MEVKLWGNSLRSNMADAELLPEKNEMNKLHRDECREKF
jgi:hypothetical protein